MRKLRVLVFMHEDLVPPDDVSGIDRESAPWRTEYDVMSTLKKVGHEVRAVGLRGDLGIIRETIEEWKPHVAFNLLEEFDGHVLYDQNVVSFLELLRVPYTGCNPRAMMLTRDKALSKKVLAFHRIPIPDFFVIKVGHRAKRPKRLGFPLIVKSLIEEASLGISQASVVRDDEALSERVKFIHDKLGTDALVEQYIDGREIYVPIMGNSRLEVLPLWELYFDKMPESAERIATARVKWSTDYQKKHKIGSGPARELPDQLSRKIIDIGKRTYKLLGMNSCGRIDLRLTDDGKIYVLEANANPQIAKGEDFADSALNSGIQYCDLLQRLLNLGIRWATTRSG